MSRKFYPEKRLCRWCHEPFWCRLHRGPHAVICVMCIRNAVKANKTLLEYRQNASHTATLHTSP